MTGLKAGHPLAWVIWVTGVLVVLTTTRNPFYLALALGAIAWVLTTWRRPRPGAAEVEEQEFGLRISVWRFAAVVVTTSALFNALMVHVGDTVLITLPPGIPLIGGPLTLEALLFGALNGLVLAGLFAAFSVLNHVLAVRSLLRLAPRAYYPAAVVMSIAVTFAPSALQQVQQVREAQAVRGHRVRGVRSWLPLLVPLLEGSLERSMQLAEAMMARGFAAGDVTIDRRPQVLMLAGLGALLGGWLLRLAWAQEAAGLALLLAGGGMLVGGLWWAGRRRTHTVYRPDAWQAGDLVIVAGAVLALLAYLPLWPWLDRSSLFYYPYPSLTWPEFSLGLGLATLGLAGPVLVR